jgi:hypothetical protein
MYAISFIFMAYLSYNWIYTGEYSVASAILLMVIFSVLGIAFSILVVQFVYAAASGRLPKWVTEPDVDNEAKLAKKFWAVFLGFITFLIIVILFLLPEFMNSMG